MRRAITLRYLSAVTASVLLSVALSGVVMAQVDESAEEQRFADLLEQRGEAAALDWLRRSTEAALAETRAELAAIEAGVDDPDVILVPIMDGVYPIHRAEIDLIMPFFPRFWSASSSQRASILNRLPALEAVAVGFERSIGSLPSLLDMDEGDRSEAIWDALLNLQARLDLTGNDLALGTTANLMSEISDLQALLTTLDEIEEDRGPLESLVVGDSPDAAPVVDEPQEEPSDTSTGGSVFDGAWTTGNMGIRMEFTQSGSSVTGPYGRMKKADENGVRTLGVIGEMAMKAIPDTRRLEGYWIKHSPSSVKCKVPRNGSDYWGQQLMVFDEAFMSWAGAWTYCDGPLWRDSGGARIEEP